MRFGRWPAEFAYDDAWKWENGWIRHSIHTKSYRGLFWAETHPPSKLRENLFSGFFFVILLTKPPTNEQMDTGENTTVSLKMHLKYCKTKKQKTKQKKTLNAS